MNAHLNSFVLSSLLLSLVIIITRLKLFGRG